MTATVAPDSTVAVEAARIVREMVHARRDREELGYRWPLDDALAGVLARCRDDFHAGRDDFLTALVGSWSTLVEILAYRTARAESADHAWAWLLEFVDELESQGITF